MVKTRLLYLAALVFGSLTALFYESSIGFVLLYGLLTLGAFALLSVLLAPLLISVKQDREGRYLLKGDEVSFTVTLRNRSLLLYPKIGLRLADSRQLQYSKIETFPLGPLERIELGFHAVIPYRGVYTIGVARVIVCDFMGLFRISFAAKAPADTVAYPCKLEDYHPPLHQDMHNRETTAFPLFSQAFEDYADLRPYDPHDDSRKIHWKLSAKKSQLIVKNFRSSTLNKTHVIIDTRPAPSGSHAPAFEDYMASLAAAVIDFALTNRLNVHLLCGPQDTEGTQAGMLTGHDGLWESLARTVFHADQGIAPCLRQVVRQEGGPVDFVLILSRLEQEDTDSLTEVCTLGHHVTLCYVLPPKQPPAPTLQERLHALEQLGVQISIFEQG